MERLQFTLQPNTSGRLVPVFTPAAIATIKKTLGFDGVQVYEDDTEGKEKGALGHPIMMPLVIDECNWEKETNSGTQRFRTDEMLLPIAMITLTRAKNMEETKMEGGNGTVKEFGGFGDYEISIAGLLIGKDGKYPEQEVKDLHEIEKAEVAVGVSNDLFLWLGITDMVIKNIKWLPMQGIENAQSFELSCVQDKEFRLKLKGEV